VTEKNSRLKSHTNLPVTVSCSQSSQVFLGKKQQK
jgi:hypothetical protein